MSSVANVLPGVPDVESPLFESIFKAKDVPSKTVEIARKLRKDGFVVIDFPDPDFDRTAEKVIRALDGRYDWQSWREGKLPGLRVQDAWDAVREVKQLACSPAILKLLSDLYGRRAFPFQTLNFPVGTQQHFHTDSVHFSTSPERFMAGVWVALEDVDSENGPLVYYPGSHALPIFTNEHIGINPDTQAQNMYGHYPSYERAWEAIVEALDLKPLYFHAKKGQALIWAANLLHGGAAQNDMKRTRYSQVTHYYFDNCAYYTPIGTVEFIGPVQFRDNIVDITTGQRVANRVNGVEIPATHIAYTNPARHLLSGPLQRPTKTPPGFDPKAYLRANPDVARAKVDAAKHWLEFGYREGRPLR
jgi:ectoine hydroxylase-related dioxygenase (phytanoyl-CoA dioxygenase family)